MALGHPLSGPCRRADALGLKVSLTGKSVIALVGEVVAMRCQLITVFIEG